MRRWMTRLRRAILLGCLFCLIAFWWRSFNHSDWLYWSRVDPRHREVREYYISSGWRGILQMGRSYHCFRCQHDYETYAAAVRGSHGLRAQSVVTTHEGPGLELVWRRFGFAADRHEYSFQPGVPCATAGGGREWRLPHWSVGLGVLAALSPDLLAFFGALRRRRRLKANRCPTCGYDVRASPERCPECGMPLLPKSRRKQ